jgi:hypothetical protein
MNRFQIDLLVELPNSRRLCPKRTLICTQGLVDHCPEFVTIVVDRPIPLRHAGRTSRAEQVPSILCVNALRVSSRDAQYSEPAVTRSGFNVFGGTSSVGAAQLSIVSLHCTTNLVFRLLLEQAVTEPTPSKRVSLKIGMARIVAAKWNKNFMSTYMKNLLERKLGNWLGWPP